MSMLTTPAQAASEERTWAMLCHLLAFSWVIGIPFGNFLGPVFAWVMKKDQYSLVDDQGKESLNFQISLFIYTMVLTTITVIAVITIVGILLLPVLISLALAIVVFKLICVITASIQANQGVRYRYPLTIRFIK